MTTVDEVIQKHLGANDVFIGYNTSGYSWEDLRIRKYAMLIYRENCNIELLFHEHVKNESINPYERHNERLIVVGHLLSPKLKDIKSILAKESIRSGSAGYAFKGKWKTPMGKEVNLSEIIDLTKRYLINRAY